MTDLTADADADAGQPPPPEQPCAAGGKTLDLGKGHSATLRDPEDITSRERKDLMLASEEYHGSQVATGLQAIEAVIALMVESWTYELPLPKDDLSVLDQLPVRAMNVLTDACKEARALLFPSFDVNPDPASPTPPSIG